MAFHKYKILIVDDEEQIRNLLKHFFSGKGFDVFLASSGKEALEAVPHYRPQIVLLDIVMEKQDGLETLKELKKRFPEFKVVMISAVHDEKIYRKCIQLGAAGYIVKPLDLSYLDALVFGKLLA
jgi:two-component system chemotaxis response regulator CheY